MLIFKITRSNRSFLKLFKTFTVHVSSDVLKHFGISLCYKSDNRKIEIYRIVKFVL